MSDTEITEKTKFQKAYDDLNDTKKALLRTGFLEQFSYKSFDTFYKKMRGETEFYKHEQIWIAEQMNIAIEKLF